MVQPFKGEGSPPPLQLHPLASSVGSQGQEAICPSSEGLAVLHPLPALPSQPCKSGGKVSLYPCLSGLLWTNSVRNAFIWSEESFSIHHCLCQGSLCKKKKGDDCNWEGQLLCVLGGPNYNLIPNFKLVSKFWSGEFCSPNSLIYCSTNWSSQMMNTACVKQHIMLGINTVCLAESKKNCPFYKTTVLSCFTAQAPIDIAKNQNKMFVCRTGTKQAQKC